MVLRIGLIRISIEVNRVPESEQRALNLRRALHNPGRILSEAKDKALRHANLYRVW